jgi:hypothetical protein
MCFTNCTLQRKYMRRGSQGQVNIIINIVDLIGPARAAEAKAEDVMQL